MADHPRANDVCAQHHFSRLAGFDNLPDDAIIRIKALSELLNVGTATIWRMSRRGQLRSIKVSERVTGWRVGDIRTYLAGLAEIA